LASRPAHWRADATADGFGDGAGVGGAFGSEAAFHFGE
jgi:hypothetical protein